MIDWIRDFILMMEPDQFGMKQRFRIILKSILDLEKHTTSPLVRQSAGWLSQQTKKVRDSYSPGKCQSISYFVKVRMITYLQKSGYIIWL